MVTLGAAACTSSALDLTPGSVSTVGGSTATSSSSNDTAQSNPTVVPATTPPATSIVTTAAPCHPRLDYGYVLPDPSCTPGANNPLVTQSNIDQTICAEGWTETVRPPESYTESLKRAQMSEYGEDKPISAYEEDHLIPLELGGAPSDPHNLWPEPGASPNPKDDVESAANHLVCEGRMTLVSAQQQIASDWVVLGRTLGVIGAAGSQTP